MLKRHLANILIGAALGAALFGCSQTLETGYEPTRLDMSLNQKRGMYAEPFTSKAQEAHQDQGQDAAARRPTQY